MGLRKRWWLWLLILLPILVVATWIVGANWALRSGYVEAKINRRPERLQIHWETGWTLIPGTVALEGLDIRRTGPRGSWSIQTDSAQVVFSPLALRHRVFRTQWIRTGGLVFAYDRHEQAEREAPAEKTEDAAQTAPRSRPSGQGAPKGEDEAQPAPARKPWRLELDGIHSAGNQDLRFNRYRLVGEGKISGDFANEPGGERSFEDGRLQLEDATLEVDTNLVGRELDVALAVEIEPYPGREIKGREVYRVMKAQLDLDGTAELLDWMNDLLENIPAVQVISGEGRLEASLTLDQGDLTPGSSLSLSFDGGAVDYLHWRAEGPMKVTAASASQDDQLVTELVLSLPDTAVSDAVENRRLLTGARLDVRGTTGPVELAGKPIFPKTLDSVHVELRDAEVTDVRNLPIPKIGDLAIGGGAATLETTATLTRDTTDARVALRGRGMRGGYGPVAMEGELEVDLDIRSRDPQRRSFTVPRGSLRFYDVAVQGGPKPIEDWYLGLEVVNGAMVIGKPARMRGDVNLSMADTRPIITIFGQNKKILNRLAPVLNFRDIQGTARVDAGGGDLSVRDADLQGKGLNLLMQFESKRGQPRGILYAKFHVLPFGVELADGRSNLVLLRAKRWYESESATWRQTAQ